MKCPGELYRRSERKYEGTPKDLNYAAMETRRVVQCGKICWRHQDIFISSALAGWSVGMEPCGQAKYNVYFGRLLLGQLDETCASFTQSMAACASGKKELA